MDPDWGTNWERFFLGGWIGGWLWCSMSFHFVSILIQAIYTICEKFYALISYYGSGMLRDTYELHLWNVVMRPSRTSDCSLWHLVLKVYKPGQIQWRDRNLVRLETGRVQVFFETLPDLTRTHKVWWKNIFFIKMK